MHDILVCVPLDRVDSIAVLFSEFNKELQFTVEKSVDNSINYVDVTLSIIDDVFITNIYINPLIQVVILISFLYVTIYIKNQ